MTLKESIVNIDEWTITNAVLRMQAETTNPRLKEVMDSLICHLHDFAREVHLTEAEWAKAVDFLTRVGHITNDKRQEFILLSRSEERRVGKECRL